MFLVGNLSQARHAALAGVLFVVLVVVATFSAGAPPGADESAGSISNYFIDHHKVLLVGAVLSSVAAPCLVWLFAGLAGALRRAGEGSLAAVTFGVGIVTVALAVASDAIWVTLVQLSWTGEFEFVKSGYELSGFFIQKAFWFAAFTALAASLAARRVLPRWYEWTTVAAGALFALGGISVKPEGFFGVNGGMALVAFVSLLLWVLATCLLLWREPKAVEAPAAASTPA